MTPTRWQVCRVVDLVQETSRVRTIVFDAPGWPGHRAGQHLDVRLTAEDGYQAERSYSIASAPEDDRLGLTVERLDDGEVSPYLVDEVVVGDTLEIRGPIGGYFVWVPADGGPLLLVAGGSGIVPLAAIVRHRVAAGSSVPTRLLYSSRTLEDVIYRNELERVNGAAENGVEVVLALTRETPDGWTGYAKRIGRDVLTAEAWPAAERPLAYVCGPTSFVEAVAGELVGLGYDPARVKTERFGPTGG